MIKLTAIKITGISSKGNALAVFFQSKSSRISISKHGFAWFVLFADLLCGCCPKLQQYMRHKDIIMIKIDLLKLFQGANSALI